MLPLAFLPAADDSISGLISLAVKAMFGRMGTELLLAGAPVKPRRLIESGFRFEFSTLEEALRFELGRTADREAIAR